MGADLTGHVRAVRRGGPGADHGHRADQVTEAQRTPHPQAERTAAAVLDLVAVVEIAQLDRPLVVTRHHEPDAATLRLLEVALGTDLAQP